MPGGFGHRGIEGKVLAAHWAREHGMPYLGLCLGLQCAVIEFAREVIGTADVNSTEFDMFTTNPVIDFMPDQRDLEDKGGTMRLGLYPAKLLAGSKARAVYGQEVVYERHRHRFEVNNRYRQTLEAAGMLLSGISPDSRLVEIVELKDHPWFVASQFHPEFKSRPERPHPLFSGFVTAAIAVREGREPVFRAPEPEVRTRRRRSSPTPATRRRPRRGPMSSDPSAAPELALRPSLARPRRRRIRHLDRRGRPARRQRLVLRPALVAVQPPRPDQRDRRLGWRRVRARRVRAHAPDGRAARPDRAAGRGRRVLPAVRDARRRVPGDRRRSRRHGLGPGRAGRRARDGRRRGDWRHGHGWPRAVAVAVLSAALLAEGVTFGLGRLVRVDQLSTDPGALLFGIEILIGLALPALILSSGERLRGYLATLALGVAGAIAIGPVTTALRGIADRF